MQSAFANFARSAPMPALKTLLDSLLSQHARLLEIQTALPEASLLVERFSGREAVSEIFRFEIDCVSTSAALDLQALTQLRPR